MKFTRSSINKPPKIVIFGREGIGKSTFASQAPNPIFIATEDRINHLGVEAPEYAPGRNYAISYEEVISALRWLLVNEHGFKTLVIDTVDSLQNFLYTNVCKIAGTKDIQDMKTFPYQRGYEIAGKRWAEEVTSLVEALNTQKKMWVIEISHVEVENVNEPDKEPYTKFTLPLHKKHIKPHVINNADIIGFIDQKVIVSEEGKAKTTGELVLKFKRSPAYNSKDSYGLPDILPFRKEDSWGTFIAALSPLLKKEKGDLTGAKEQHDKNKSSKLEETLKNNKEGIEANG